MAARSRGHASMFAHNEQWVGYCTDGENNADWACVATAGRDGSGYLAEAEVIAIEIAAEL